MTAVKSTLKQGERSKRIRWIRLGGICGFISALLLIGAAILNLNIGAADVLRPFPNVLSFYQPLLRGSLDAYLGVLGTLFFLVTAAGLYAMLADSHELSWAAPATVSAGAFILAATLGITLVLQRRLAPQFFIQDLTELPATGLDVILLTSAGLLLVLGCGLIYGAGVILYAYFMRNWPVLPGWIGRLGVIAGILQIGWLDAIVPAPFSSWFIIFKVLNLFLFLAWLAITATMMVRVADIAIKH